MKLEKPIIFFDVETTGLDTSKDQIIEVSFVKLNIDMTKEIKTKRFNPDVEINPKAQEIHGTSKEDLKDEPKFKQFAKEIYTFLQGCDIAGFNSNKFDVPMLYSEFLRAGIEWDYSGVNFIDVSNIYRILNPRTLVQAYKDYCDKDLTDAHSAESDTLATLEVFTAQLEKHDELPKTSKEISFFSNYEKDILDISGCFTNNDEGEIVFNFGKHKDNLAKNQKNYINWMLKSSFAPDTKKICSLILNN